MQKLKCGFCALLEGCLYPSSLEVLCVTLFLPHLYLFRFPPVVQTCFDARRTDVAFKQVHGHLSRGLRGKLFPCILSDGTSAAEIADFSADAHFFVYEKQDAAPNMVNVV